MAGLGPLRGLRGHATPTPPNQPKARLLQDSKGHRQEEGLGDKPKDSETRTFLRTQISASNAYVGPTCFPLRRWLRSWRQGQWRGWWGAEGCVPFPEGQPLLDSRLLWPSPWCLNGGLFTSKARVRPRPASVGPFWPSLTTDLEGDRLGAGRDPGR